MPHLHAALKETHHVTEKLVALQPHAELQLERRDLDDASVEVDKLAVTEFSRQVDTSQPSSRTKGAEHNRNLAPSMASSLAGASYLTGVASRGIACFQPSPL